MSKLQPMRNLHSNCGPLVRACLFMLVFILPGCERKPSSLPNPNPPASAQSTQGSRTDPVKRQPFQIILSAGGGFTGLYSGCTLASDGTVSHWQKFRGRDTVLAKAAGSSEKVLALRGKLEAGGALSVRKEETGNMTTRVELVTDEATYAWFWSGSGANENTPTELKAWYADAAAYCQSFPIPSASK